MTPNAFAPRAGEPRSPHAYAYGESNPVTLHDPLGLKPCKGDCAECPSGYWTYIDRSWSYGAIWGSQSGQVTYICIGRASKRCSFSYSCRTVGLQGGLWGGVDAGAVGGPDCGCSEALADSFVNGNFFTIAGGAFAAQSKCTGGGFDAGGGLGAAFVSKPYDCTVSNLSCTK
jgi:hypothetical protein